MTPYQLPRFITFFIAVKDWCLVEIGKHSSIKILRRMFSPEKFTDEDLVHAKNVLRSLSSKTIWRSFYSCNNYSMPNTVTSLNCPMQYWYGSEEKNERKADIAYIKKTFPSTSFVENFGMGHAEYFSLHPKEFCAQLMQFLGD